MFLPVDITPDYGSGNGPLPGDYYHAVNHGYDLFCQSFDGSGGVFGPLHGSGPINRRDNDLDGCCSPHRLRRPD